MKDIQDFEFCLWHKPRKRTNVASWLRCLPVGGRPRSKAKLSVARISQASHASQRCACERISPHTKVPFQCTESSERQYFVTSCIILFQRGQEKRSLPPQIFFPNHLPLIKPLCSSTILPCSLILNQVSFCYYIFFLTKGKF